MKSGVAFWIKSNICKDSMQEGVWLFQKLWEDWWD